MTTTIRTQKTTPAQQQEKRKPLQGVRMLVLEDFLVLPWASVLLAELGAEVIRIEAGTRMVSRRFTPFPDNEPGAEWWNESGTFSLWYRGKKSVVLNMQSAKGRELFNELVKVSDIVASNFRADVQERLGLVESGLRKIKKDLIILNVTGFGSTGPWRNYGAFARTIDGFTSLSHLTGYVGGEPVRANDSYMDMTGGLNWAQALILALMHRDKTGEGVNIDASMYETGIMNTAPAILEAQKTHDSPPRRGNGHEWMAPHGCYQCKGHDRWLVVAVDNDAMWKAMKPVMGNPKWADDKRFDTNQGRFQNRAELDQHIASWTADRDNKDLFHAFQKAGVNAAPVFDAKDIMLDQHIEARGFLERFTSPKERVGKRIQPQRPYKFSGSGLTPQWVADFGEHNRYVLRDLLGHTDEEIELFIADGIVSEIPDIEELDPPPTSSSKRLIESKWGETYDPDFKKILKIE